MHVGVAMFCTDYAIAPTELAKALEDRGFESLWLPEHSHIPLTRASPFPQGGDLPKKYYDVMDPFVVLGAAAAVTTRLKIATGIFKVSAMCSPMLSARLVLPMLGRPATTMRSPSCSPDVMRSRSVKPVATPVTSEGLSRL